MIYLTPSPGLLFWQIVVFGFWVILVLAIIDVLRSKFEGNDKLIWVLITILVPFGGILYYIFGRKNKVIN